MSIPQCQSGLTEAARVESGSLKLRLEREHVDTFKYKKYATQQMRDGDFDSCRNMTNPPISHKTLATG